MLTAQFLYNPAQRANHCHAPSLILTNSGDLLATWYAYPEDESVDGSLVIARKVAAENEWRPSEDLLGDFQHSAGNPLLFESPKGQINLLFVLIKGNYWNDAELQGSVSLDGGHTWEPHWVAHKGSGMMVRHSPVLLRDGSAMLPAYDEERQQAVLLHARPPFRSWKEHYRFEDLALIQPSLVRLHSNALMLFFRPAGNPYVIWRSRSADEGTTWSTPVRTPLPTPSSGISAVNLGTQVAVAYNHTHEHQRFPLSLSVSPDEGVSWSDNWDFEPLEHEVCYPSMVNEDDRWMHIVYTYNRRMIKYVRLPASKLENL